MGQKITSSMSTLPLDLPESRITNQDILEFMAYNNISYIPTKDLKYINKAIPFIEKHSEIIAKAKNDIEKNNISYKLLVEDGVCSESLIYHGKDIPLFKEFIIYVATKYNTVISSETDHKGKQLKEELADALKRLEDNVDKDIELTKLKQENEELRKELENLYKYKEQKKNKTVQSPANYE